MPTEEYTTEPVPTETDVGVFVTDTYDVEGRGDVSFTVVACETLESRDSYGDAVGRGREREVESRAVYGNVTGRGRKREAGRGRESEALE